MDILALRAQNLQQLSASLDQATVQNTLFLAYNKPTVHKIPQAHSQYNSVHKIATHSRNRGAELSAHHRIQQFIAKHKFQRPSSHPAQ
jgi:hypothetical protein